MFPWAHGAVSGEADFFLSHPPPSHIQPPKKRGGGRKKAAVVAVPSRKEGRPENEGKVYFGSENSLERGFPNIFGEFYFPGNIFALAVIFVGKSVCSRVVFLCVERLPPK